jgi:hypothetical protein
VCQYLSEDGLTLASMPQHIWRLPTVDEAVRSMARHVQNSGGVWDADIAKATYKTTPDKESPLWNVRSQVIYWWTATELLISATTGYGTNTPLSKDDYGWQLCWVSIVEGIWFWVSNPISFLPSPNNGDRIKFAKCPGDQNRTYDDNRHR